MTVDELLAKLDAEYEQINSALPKVYEDYGRAAYPAIQNTVSGVYASDFAYEREQIKTREARKERIRYVQQLIRMEMPYKIEVTA